MNPTHNWEGAVPVADILTHIAPAYAGPTWADAVTHLTQTPSEMAVIDLLLADLAAGKPFREPVRVTIADPNLDDDEEHDGFLPREPWKPQVANGMHRIAASILAEVPTVPVTKTETAPPWEEPAVRIEFTLHPIPGREQTVCGQSEDAWHHAGDFAGDWLRSFPLDEDTWVEACLFSSSCGVMTGYWYVDHSRVEEFLTEVTRRCDAHGWRFEKVNVTLE